MPITDAEIQALTPKNRPYRISIGEGLSYKYGQMGKNSGGLSIAWMERKPFLSSKVHNDKDLLL